MTETNPAVGHEVKDAGIRPIVLTGIGLAVITVLTAVAVFAIFRVLQDVRTPGQPGPMEAAGAAQFPPEPRITAHPSVELQELHRAEDQTLSTYGWVDRKQGIVRIPIDRAIDLQLQRGYPVRKEAPKQ
jgi:hypothetical protein